MKPIKELTITFKEGESVPEVILNGVNLNKEGVGLTSVNVNWFTKGLSEDGESIEDMLKRNVSLEFYDQPGKNMAKCKLSQSFKL
ncbi:TPA: hypothetical protein ACGAW8_002128 [Streptococcus agalactiae]|nr:hypothetical protein [Streptococcus agalactiae]MCC9697745.1 hypothetical protein [Streptococcus agalactiae]MCC9734503.1 hypothetical protein [Streptococcus agalactiae]MCC9755318.1 hypothetical protein [Streptococcus agalactiae]MCC9762894.1 hypothetical protein [Streptococcus agalactiae]